MRILLVGGGGREHAIAWKLKQDDPGIELCAAPGNAGIADLASCFAIGATDIAGLLALAEREQIDFTIVGPEAPLDRGIVDAFAVADLAIFGPSRAAARIESSKRFAKELMLEHGIPTGLASWHRDGASAKEAARRFGAPLVIKASGLAGGKGVVVCESIDEADSSIDSMLRDRVHGAADDEVLVEEFLPGEELSIFALCDGRNAVIMLPVQDHKRLLAGDVGPNTGGMGAYAPVGMATPELLSSVTSRIIAPMLTALEEHGCAFRGLLYCGLMVESGASKVVEFNCRFGDPETEALLPLMSSNLLSYLEAASHSGGLSGVPSPEFSGLAAVTTVVAAPGYPEAPLVGAQIELPPIDASVQLFHCGTKRGADGALTTAGGRVIAVTAVDADFETAQQKSAATAEGVQFAGRQFRDDIGWREVRRRAGAA